MPTNNKSPTDKESHAQLPRVSIQQRSEEEKNILENSSRFPSVMDQVHRFYPLHTGRGSGMALKNNLERLSPYSNQQSQ
jgi:hypothetical protein